MNKKAELFVEGMMSVLAIAPAHAVARPNFIAPTSFEKTVVTPVKQEEVWLAVGGYLRTSFDGQVALLSEKDRNFIKQAG